MKPSDWQVRIELLCVCVCVRVHARAHACIRMWWDSSLPQRKMWLVSNPTASQTILKKLAFGFPPYNVGRYMKVTQRAETASVRPESTTEEIKFGRSRISRPPSYSALGLWIGLARLAFLLSLLPSVFPEFQGRLWLRRERKLLLELGPLHSDSLGWPGHA